MYSFEGDFRRKPVQSLRGASKKVTKWSKVRYFSKNIIFDFQVCKYRSTYTQGNIDYLGQETVK